LIDRRQYSVFLELSQTEAERNNSRTEQLDGERVFDSLTAFSSASPLRQRFADALRRGFLRYDAHKIGIETSCFDTVLVAGILPWFGTNAGGVSLQVSGIRLQ
jgi:hypothetical protein